MKKKYTYLGKSVNLNAEMEMDWDLDLNRGQFSLDFFPTTLPHGADQMASGVSPLVTLAAGDSSTSARYSPASSEHAAQSNFLLDQPQSTHVVVENLVANEPKPREALLLHAELPDIPGAPNGISYVEPSRHAPELVVHKINSLFINEMSVGVTSLYLVDGPGSLPDSVKAGDLLPMGDHVITMGGGSAILRGHLVEGLSLNEKIGIYDGETRVGDAQVNGDSWSFTTEKLESAPHHSFVAKLEDVSGATLLSSKPLEVDVQFICMLPVLPPSEPKFFDPLDDFQVICRLPVLSSEPKFDLYGGIQFPAIECGPGSEIPAVKPMIHALLPTPIAEVVGSQLGSSQQGVVHSSDSSSDWQAPLHTVLPEQQVPSVNIF